MIPEKSALITGITGQDGSYLAELLLNKGYTVHGIRRRSSLFNTDRIDHVYLDPHNEKNKKFFLHYGDLSDSSSITKIIQEIKPNEIYNLAAQSHVGVSFENPEYTANINALGALRLLEAIRFLKLEDQTRYYQASTSELFGLVQETPQRETTPFYPRSPYAVSKLFAYWITINYREAYKIFACNGILFNHESKRRGETFITRKITRALANIAYGIQNTVFVGNLDAKRDWGHAQDYVKMQWMMLQQDKPKDYVIATGQQISVRDFIVLTAKKIGIELSFENSGVNEIGRVTKVWLENAPAVRVGDIIIRVDPGYFRPTEVDSLIGDSKLAYEELGWKPETSFEELISEMVSNDLNQARKISMLRLGGYQSPINKE